jgi:hypothetical protein
VSTTRAERLARAIVHACQNPEPPARGDEVERPALVRSLRERGRCARAGRPLPGPSAPNRQPFPAIEPVELLGVYRDPSARQQDAAPAGNRSVGARRPGRAASGRSPTHPPAAHAAPFSDKKRSCMARAVRLAPGGAAGGRRQQLRRAGGSARKALTAAARDGIYLRRCNNGKEVIPCLTLRWRVAQIRRSRLRSRPSGSADAAENINPNKSA